MSLNDKSMAAGVSNDVWPGTANPTSRSTGGDYAQANFINDPTTEDKGAGAPENFEGHRMAKKAMQNGAGVVESRPGIIETTNINPLNEDSNKDDGWANAIDTPEGKGDAGLQSSVTTNAGEVYNTASNMATGAAKAAYGTATGNRQMAEEGKAVFGSN